MDRAWSTFSATAPGWPRVQAIYDWVHGTLRFDAAANHPQKGASETLATGAGVCRDFAHLAISLCR